jgi:thiol:disulfide interchange protein
VKFDIKMAVSIEFEKAIFDFILLKTRKNAKNTEGVFNFVKNLKSSINMKKHLFLLIFTLLSALLRAQTQVDFFKGSFEEAKQLAKTQKKLIFIDFYTQWCSP